MAGIEFAGRIAEDIQRIVAHLAAHEASASEERVMAIFRTLQVLGDNPLIGRVVRNGLREIFIGRDSHGYLVLYRHEPFDDTVYVLAIRAQREAGYAVDFPSLDPS